MMATRRLSLLLLVCTMAVMLLSSLSVIAEDAPPNPGLTLSNEFGLSQPLDNLFSVGGFVYGTVEERKQQAGGDPRHRCIKSTLARFARRFVKDAQQLETLVTLTEAESEFCPGGIAVDPKQRLLYVIGRASGTVVEYSLADKAVVRKIVNRPTVGSEEESRCHGYRHLMLDAQRRRLTAMAPQCLLNVDLSPAANATAPLFSVPSNFATPLARDTVLHNAVLLRGRNLLVATGFEQCIACNGTDDCRQCQQFQSGNAVIVVNADTLKFVNDHALPAVIAQVLPGDRNGGSLIVAANTLPYARLMRVTSGHEIVQTLDSETLLPPRNGTHACPMCRTTSRALIPVVLPKRMSPNGAPRVVLLWVIGMQVGRSGFNHMGLAVVDAKTFSVLAKMRLPTSQVAHGRPSQDDPDAPNAPPFDPPTITAASDASLDLLDDPLSQDPIDDGTPDDDRYQVYLSAAVTIEGSTVNGGGNSLLSLSLAPEVASEPVSKATLAVVLTLCIAAFAYLIGAFVLLLRQMRK